MDPEIIFQCSDYVVINKPAGIAMHGDGRGEQRTIADWILENFPETKGVGEDIKIKGSDKVIEKPGIMHRLDKDTSGVVLIALNEKAYKHFKKQFMDRKVQKVYHLFAYGNLREDLIVVDLPIGKDRKDFRKRTTKSPRGKVRESLTNLKVLKRGKDSDEHFVFVEARPKTGRMHQIRVHMRSLNTPIICDHLYAPKKKPLLSFDRLALHAKSLNIFDSDGKELFFEAEYPDDFKNALGGI